MTELISTMNDTKWRRLLHAIAPIWLPVSYWTFLNDDSEYSRSTPQPEEILNDVAIGDTSIVGSYYFRDIQRVRWPKEYETAFGDSESVQISTQPIGELADAIRKAGQFDFSLSENNLILLAYREID